MKLSLIAAVAANGVIGRANQLPWHLPADLKYFVRMTMGKPVIMGRLTWDSIAQPLPGRTNIVVSRQPGLQIDGVQVAPDLVTALALGETLQQADGQEEMMVVGGAQIYRAALPLAQRMYLTEVHADFSGDASFPEWNRDEWREQSRQLHRAEGAEPCDYSFVVYERV